MKPLDQFNFNRIIIAAYKLPFKLIRKKEEYYTVQNSGGLVSAVLSLAEKINTNDNDSDRIVWVGTGDSQLANEEVRPGVKMVPVIIPRKVNDKYYGGFCNDTIWPLFHYFPSRTVYEPDYFDAYLTANKLFFDKLKDLIQPGDFIWIHDYQLFLLPEMIRKSFPKADIGFFLHIPFPSYEVFRLLPRRWREKILSGMAGADVIGFHTNDYTQHFIKSVRRTLGYRTDQNLIFTEERICKADSFPIGIDFSKFHDACFAPKTNQQKVRIKKYLAENRLIFSVDRLDYSKGFLFRLKAFERFLEQHPEWHFRVVFNMVVVPSRDNILEYIELKKEIEATVGRINGKYSTLKWRPLVYQYRSLPFNEMVAIYNLSDVGLITPLRDGMNLVAKEYIACQKEHFGMLVLSDMAGAAAELTEALLITPTDVEETAEALHKALVMPDAEKEKRVRKMQERLSRYNVFTWTTDFFTQVDLIKKEKKKIQVKYLDETISGNILRRFRESRNRLFLFDYDGTLTPIVNLPHLAVMDHKTEDILINIISDPDNTVIIISGRNREFMDEQFTGLNAVLIAEHGFFIKYPGEEWSHNVEVDLSWKKKVLPVLNDHVDRCSGSMVEDKYASLVWHYRNADEETASLRINELKDDLTEILKGESKLQVLEGNKVLEIKSIIYDKGTIADHIINTGTYDFILAIGDDITDEDLFRSIPAHGYTIRVGTKPSNARYNIKDQSQIPEFLSVFAKNNADSPRK
ncbi:MAG: bifunctional alpha,alpha-trehalose-phosphate synthase (UDP-forming)/trehalose-phosphatase [Bacteroidota bacterium]